MTVQTPNTFLALCNHAARGNFRAIADALRSLAVGEPYQTVAGTPLGAVTPRAIGDQVLDTTNNVLYRALGLTNTSWYRQAIGGALIVAAGAALTLTAAQHAGRTIKLDTLAGSVVTLPAATGTGDKYRFYVGVLATSNSHKIQVANGTDIIQGLIVAMTDNSNAALVWAAAGTSDTITLNRSTTGSVTVGEWIEIEDVAAGVFTVRGVISATGTEATPFSAAV